MVDDADGAFGGCEGLVACEEAEALGVFAPAASCAEIAVAETDLADLRRRSRGCRRLCRPSPMARELLRKRSSAALLDGDRGAYRVSPACIFKTDGLNALDHFINIQAGVLGDLLGFLDGGPMPYCSGRR
jgi:hypothetical protein